MSATISKCGNYRYFLKRDLMGDMVRPHHERVIAFCMLNPSTADADQDDPTIRRCIDFAKREGGTLLQVVNLYALRATDPNEIGLWVNRGLDPIGPENDGALRLAAHTSDILILAWGTMAAPVRAERALKVLREGRAKLCYFGHNSNGSPKHPLYIRKTQPLLEWK